MDSSKQSSSSRVLPPWIGIRGDIVKLFLFANFCVEKVDYEKLARMAKLKKETCENRYRQALNNLIDLWGLGGNPLVTELEGFDLPQSQSSAEDTPGSNEDVDSNESAEPVETPLSQDVAAHCDPNINAVRDEATAQGLKTKDEAPKVSDRQPDPEMSIIKIDDSSSTAGEESDTVTKSPVTPVKPKRQGSESSIKKGKEAHKSSKTTSSSVAGKKLEKPAERKRPLKRRRQDTDSDGDSDTEGYLPRSSNIKGDKKKEALKETKKKSPQSSRPGSMTPGQNNQLVSVSSPPPDSFVEDRATSEFPKLLWDSPKPDAPAKATKDDTTHEQAIDNGRKDSGSEQEIVGAAMDGLSLEVDFLSDHSEEDDECDPDYCDDPCDGPHIGFHRLKFHGEIAQDSDSEWA